MIRRVVHIRVAHRRMDRESAVIDIAARVVLPKGSFFLFEVIVMSGMVLAGNGVAAFKASCARTWKLGEPRPVVAS